MTASFPGHTILSLTTQSAAFFGDTHLDFAPGLNTLIGGRGSGKSSLLYLLRFGLGTAVPESYAADFDATVEHALGAGSVTVRVRTQHGVVYSATRSYGEPPKVRNAAGELVDLSLDDELFRVDAYAAKEIEEIASSPLRQLTLLERFELAELRRLSRAIAEGERRLGVTGAEIDRLDDEIAADAALEADLPAVTEALTALTPEGAAEGSDLAQAEARRPLRGREHQAMAGAVDAVAQVGRALDLFATNAPRLLEGAVDASLEQGDGPVAAAFRRAHAALHTAVRAVETTAADLRAELTVAATAIEAESRAVAALHDTEDEAYKALVVRSDSDRSRAMQREALHRRRDELGAIARRAADKRQARAEKQTEHEARARDVEAQKTERHAVFERIAARVTAEAEGEITLKVGRGGIFDEYEALLASLVEGAGLPKAFVSHVATSVAPADLFRAVRTDDVGAIVAVDPMKTGKAGRAARFLAAVRASGRARAIETAPLRDLPSLRLNVRGEWRPAGEGSTGEKCTAILPILLLPSESPLLADQIEDHLDNRYVYQVLVPTLLAAKRERQIILSTHSPNISVLADADRVFELDVKDRKGCVAAVGTVDDLLPQIELVLEGGRPAFVRRGERYGHLPKSTDGKKPEMRARRRDDGAADAEST